MADRILIVDDDADSRDYLRVVLAAAGYETIEAEDGQAALALLGTHGPDLVLLDIVMPGEDGFAVCRRIRAQGRHDDVPVVFLSARSEASDKIAGLRAGGADYITKPFDAGETLARVQNQLEIRRLTLELKRTNLELNAKQRKLDEDLRAAALIQQSLLPRRPPSLDAVKVAWTFHPSATIGGDIFNVMELDRSTLGFYMLDVSGHGISAALVAVSASQALLPQSGLLFEDAAACSHDARLTMASPSELLQKLDQMFPFERFGRHFTIAYLILDLASGLLTYSSAGHPPPVVVSRNGSVRVLDKGGTFIGLGGIVPFEEDSVRLEAGDKVFLYTDGITEYQDAEEGFFGAPRFYELLRLTGGDSLQDALNRIDGALREFGQGREQADDVSLLCFSYLGDEPV